MIQEMLGQDFGGTEGKRINDRQVKSNIAHYVSQLDKMLLKSIKHQKYHRQSRRSIKCKKNWSPYIPEMERKVRQLWDNNCIN